MSRGGAGQDKRQTGQGKANSGRWVGEWMGWGGAERDKQQDGMSRGRGDPRLAVRPVTGRDGQG